MGIAETPELPIRGLILPFVIQQRSFAVKTPPIVPKANAKSPEKRMISVCGVRNRSAVAEDPILKPTRSVSMFNISV